MTASKRDAKADWRCSLSRMEAQGNVEGVRYFRALLGGWSQYEAERIAKGENVSAVASSPGLPFSVAS